MSSQGSNWNAYGSRGSPSPLLLALQQAPRDRLAVRTLEIFKGALIELVDDPLTCGFMASIYQKMNR